MTDTLTLRAAYVLPHRDKVIDGGWIEIGGPRIVEVGNGLPRADRGRVIDLGNAAVIPGLVNAHTHLELSDLQGKIPPPKSFTQWLGHILAFRRREAGKPLDRAVEKGVSLSLESGTTTVADISSTGDSLRILPNLPIRKRVFKEVICLEPDKVSGVMEGTIRELSSLKNAVGAYCDVSLLSAGLSPHAPYTACPKLYLGCALFAQGSDLLLCTHICETLEEVEFLREGTGSFAIMLKALNMLEGWRPPGMYPLEYLKSTGALKGPWLLVHCNYLSGKEVKIIEETTSSVVYCPRSHRYFGHSEHPFQDLLKRGINVALGTDSLASNQSLSILDEARFLHENYPGLDPVEIFSMATEGGAKALRLEEKIGRLIPGMEADLAVIELPSGEGTVYERMLAPEARVILTMVAGRVCYDRYSLM
ncbi:MAG TPA: amidohydrolase family protein [Candidatus Tripitaka californicus]|uniref:amidohydrolase family protein n=1 Tax=Candidatus Tripitaka californicus TaxID=3367616 RepID=UPI00402720D6|nr:amidohydrolase family protein [Planctomycetota bacterium]